jgi:hypothetical protein
VCSILGLVSYFHFCLGFLGSVSFSIILVFKAFEVGLRWRSVVLFLKVLNGWRLTLPLECEVNSEENCCVLNVLRD